MSYKIVITKSELKTVKDQSYEKIADTGNERDGKAVYGYVPVTLEKNNETTILEQVVETLDLEAVIKAVNQIK